MRKPKRFDEIMDLIAEADDASKPYDGPVVFLSSDPAADPIELAAEHLYGYGRWSAPYWFIGPEPGMKKNEGDNLEQRCRAWYDLCGGDYRELLDCRKHHEAFHQMRFFTRSVRMQQPINGETLRPPMQDTWRRLIRLLLAYEGKCCDNDAVGDYQWEKWAAEGGDTCVVELSALAANSMQVKRDRKRFRDNRVKTLAKRLAENDPEFVVLYGKECQKEFEVIAGGPFDDRGYRWRGGTLCAFVTHPVTHGVSDDWWVEKGRDMRLLVDARGNA